MEPQQIVENNRLIAEFLDIKGKVDYHDGKGFRDCYWLNGGPYSVESLRFNSEWGLLIEAVEKVESKGYAVEIVETYCLITKPKNNGLVIADLGGGDFTKLSATYEAVILFIQWHNQQSK